jgi:hypothetical protein
MAWTYSGDPNSSDKDKYRFLIGDTISTDPILADEEITFILNTYQPETTRLYYLYNSAANVLSNDIKKSLGPQSEDPTSRLEHFQKNAKEYKSKMNASGLSLPTYASCKSFTKGLHDNV